MIKHILKFIKQRYGPKTRSFSLTATKTLDTISVDAFKMNVGALKITNYYSWSNELEVVLRGKGIWKFVDPTN